MKYLIVGMVIAALMICYIPEVSGQIKNPAKTAGQEGEKRVNRGIGKGIDKGFDKVEEGLGSLFKKNKKDENTGSATQETSEVNVTEERADNAVSAGKDQVQHSLTWAKFDFVPGDAVIFEDDLQGEENGEFPSRWDLLQGNVEVAQFDGENVIMMRDGAPVIIPYFKDPREDHLPDVFTIELDLFYPKEHPFQIYLYDRKNQKSDSPTGYTYISVSGNEMSMGRATSEYPEDKDLNRWMHISIAYTNGKLKAYLDDTRLINIPRLDFNPSGISLHAYHASNENLCYIKNIRIASGGVKYYDRVMQDGKIIVNGIRFDVGKSTLKPESMGAINEIFNLMKENPDLRFSIEGHTDSQGDDAFNLKLSEERAVAVMNTLIKMGIAASRLSAKGWGETKPISANASPEDMANNRRVEFVKI